MAATMERISPAEQFKDVKEVRYGYDNGQAIVFVKDGNDWYELFVKPLNPNIAEGIKRRFS
jgi:hypothetical protein